MKILQGPARHLVDVLPPVPSADAFATVIIDPSLVSSPTTLLASICPPLISEIVPVLSKVLGQMAVDRLASMVVPLRAELFGDDMPQEEPVPLSAMSLLSSLQVSLMGVSNLSVLAGGMSPIPIPTPVAALSLLSLVSITILLEVRLSFLVQPFILEAGPLDHPLIVSIPLVVYLSGPPVTIDAATRLLRSAPLLPLLF